MRTYNSNGLNKICLTYRQITGKAFCNQIKKVIESLFSEPMTMLMPLHETKTNVGSVYRCVGLLRHSNRISVAKVDLCKISKNKSTNLTADPELSLMSNHLKSVDDGK